MLYRCRRADAFLCALVAAALALLFGAAAPAELARVQQVLDGDSLRLVDGREVRLIGINAPEFGRDGRPHQPLAAAARERVRALVRARTVRLRYDDERFDRYGRALAYVELPDGRELQETLLREGFAWFVAIPPNVARLSSHRAAESQARRARRGIWALEAYRPIPAERLTPDDTGFARIVGTADRVSYDDGAAVLWLTARVHLMFPRAGGESPYAPRTLVGKRVLARGWLTEYKNGLRLRITHPAMLEVLP